MRTFVLIILAGLLTAAVARPFQRRPSPADAGASVTQSLSLPSTPILETSTSSVVPDGTLVPGQPGYGVYSLLMSQTKFKPTSIERIRLVKRQEYHILPEPNDQAAQTTSMSANETVNTTTQTNSSTNSTKGVDEPPPAKPVNLVPHWNTKTHSIAAAVIFIIVVVVAFLALLALYFKKVERFFQRRRRDKKGLTLPKYDDIVADGDEMPSTMPLNKESKSDRDAYSFEIVRSHPRSPPPEYIVEEDPELGSVTRVYRLSRADYNNYPRHAPTFHEQEKESVVDMSPPVVPPTGKLRESVQKPVLIVPTPLNPLNRVKSFSATTELQQIYDPVSRGSQDDSELLHRSSTNGSRITRYSDPGPNPNGNPNRVSFLPRIHRSSSPLFTFEE